MDLIGSYLEYGYIYMFIWGPSSHHSGTVSAVVYTELRRLHIFSTEAPTSLNNK